MKKKYLLYIIFTIVLFTFNSVVFGEDIAPANKAFDDINFYKCVVDTYNSGKSVKKDYLVDSLSDDELKTIKSLTCSGTSKPESEKISSTKGLEKLVSLTSLALNSNNLSTIDVTKNTQLTELNLGFNKLEKLDLQQNKQLNILILNSTNISSINLTNNTKLQKLEAKSTELTSLDVTNNKELTYLDLGNNKLISEIDLSNNVLLTYLAIGGNGGSGSTGNGSLEKIDLSNNINLEYLNLSYNKLKDLNLLSNTKLKTVYLSCNKFKSIDLSKNKEIETLYLTSTDLTSLNLDNQINLKRLFVESSQLSTLDLSNNILLEALSADTNYIESLDLSKNINLIDVSIAGHSYNGARNYLKSLILPDGNSLMSLQVQNNLLSFLDFKKQNNIEVLNISNNNFFSINLSNLTSVKEKGPINMRGQSAVSSSITNQKYTVKPEKKNNKYQINLKEYDKNLDPSKVIFANIEGLQYDNKTGVITLTDKLSTISYIYKTNLPSKTEVSEDMNVTLTLTYQHEIKEFYIGGNSNPEYATSTNSSVYLSWDDDNITHYCISQTISSNNCEWKNTIGKSAKANYTLPSGDGVKKLYAFIKNKEGLISAASSDTIILDTTKPVIEYFYIGGKTNPETIETNKTSIYLSWQDEDVVKYCINTSDNIDECKWIDTTKKVIEEEYTLLSGEGEIILYAFIQDAAGHISEVAVDKITIKVPKEDIDPPYTGANSLIKIIAISTIGLIIVYIILKKKRAIYKI